MTGQSLSHTRWARSYPYLKYDQDAKSKYIESRKLGKLVHKGTRAYHAYPNFNHKEFRDGTNESGQSCDVDHLRGTIEVTIKVRCAQRSFADRGTHIRWLQNMNALISRSYISPFVAVIHEIIYDDNAYYMVMEKVDGVDLVEFCKTELCRSAIGNLQPASDAQKLDFTRFYIHQVLVALRDLQKAGFYHKDVKPENVIVMTGRWEGIENFENEMAVIQQQGDNHCSKNMMSVMNMSGRVKVIDFDTCEVIDNAFKPFWVLGTDQYIAPEVYNGEYTDATEAFSVGVMMYRLLLDRLPFPKEVFTNERAENYVGSHKTKSVHQNMISHILRNELTSSEEIIQRFGLSALDILKKMITVTSFKSIEEREKSMNQCARLTIDQCMKYPFFGGIDEPTTSIKRRRAYYNQGGIDDPAIINLRKEKNVPPEDYRNRSHDDRRISTTSCSLRCEKLYLCAKVADLSSKSYEYTRKVGQERHHNDIITLEDTLEDTLETCHMQDNLVVRSENSTRASSSKATGSSKDSQESTSKEPLNHHNGGHCPGGQNFDQVNPSVVGQLSSHYFSHVYSSRIGINGFHDGISTVGYMGYDYGQDTLGATTPPTTDVHPSIIYRNTHHSIGCGMNTHRGVRFDCYGITSESHYEANANAEPIMQNSWPQWNLQQQPITGYGQNNNQIVDFLTRSGPDRAGSVNPPNPPILYGGRRGGFLDYMQCGDLVHNCLLSVNHSNHPNNSLHPNGHSLQHPNGPLNGLNTNNGLVLPCFNSFGNNNGFNLNGMLNGVLHGNNGNYGVLHGVLNNNGFSTPQPNPNYRNQMTPRGTPSRIPRGSLNMPNNNIPNNIPNNVNQNTVHQNITVHQNTVNQNTAQNLGNQNTFLAQNLGNMNAVQNILANVSQNVGQIGDIMAQINQTQMSQLNLGQASQLNPQVAQLNPHVNPPMNPPMPIEENPDEDKASHASSYQEKISNCDYQGNKYQTGSETIDWHTLPSPIQLQTDMGLVDLDEPGGNLDNVKVRNPSMFERKDNGVKGNNVPPINIPSTVDTGRDNNSVPKINPPPTIITPPSMPINSMPMNPPPGKNQRNQTPPKKYSKYVPPHSRYTYHYHAQKNVRSNHFTNGRRHTNIGNGATNGANHLSSNGEYQWQGSTTFSCQRPGGNINNTPGNCVANNGGMYTPRINNGGPTYAAVAARGPSHAVVRGGGRGVAYISPEKQRGMDAWCEARMEKKD